MYNNLGITHILGYQSMRNFFNNIKGEDIFQSSKPVAVSAFLLVAIIITSLLSVRYYLLQDIVKNGIATKTIVAKNTTIQPRLALPTSRLK